MKYLGFRLKLVLFIGAILLIVFGGDQVMQGLRYHEPTVISYEDFAKQKPTAGWFHVKNCVFNVFRAMHFYDKDHPEGATDVSGITEVYVPVQSAKEPQIPGVHPKTSVLINTSDPAILNTYRELAQFNADPSGAPAYIAKNKSRIYVKRDVEGMVKVGLSSVGSDRVKLLKDGISPLDDDFITLEEGKKPSPGVGSLMLTLGIVLLVGQILFYIARRGR